MVQRAGAPGRGRRRAGHGRPAQRPDRAAFLSDGETPEAGAALRAAETTGRPFGDAAFIKGTGAESGSTAGEGSPGASAETCGGCRVAGAMGMGMESP